MEKYIGPGEFYASDEDVIISTLLGSCISVALYDPITVVGGLNHFMLPFPKTKDSALQPNTTRYGINAMEMLINDILKLGGKKNQLLAKVFGGGAVLEHLTAATYDVPKMNIKFAFEFLETEGIPIKAYNVGGNLPRRLFFFPQTAKVFMKYSKKETHNLARTEKTYSQTADSVSVEAGTPILF
ncbi:chemotaxis protein CheD [Brucepastera parasyntrophica]|uniref:chemotaxis protein CheD n=1 Tax=Brucepastera parasyntrophica TaxID=2880008 RepID=UPI00210DFC9B|nr:chemotaxis protein CheD [Brucepastera parasyntrophica]ULQ58924.1 chemotaxis protein CheD [Brucepastera parasyntrophica]